MPWDFWMQYSGKTRFRPSSAFFLQRRNRRLRQEGCRFLIRTIFFLKKGEKIHYIDKAINLEIKTKKPYAHIGRSSPGLLQGNRWSAGVAKPIESTELVQHKGILYVTNQRIVFQASEGGYDKTYKTLTAITPYTDACEIQFGNKTYNMIVADGNLLNQVLQLIKQRRSIY